MMLIIYRVRLELTPPGEGLGAEITFVGKNSGVHGALVNLKVRFGPKRLVTESALEISLSLMKHLYMRDQLQSTGQHFTTNIAWIHLLWNTLSLAIDPMFSGPVT